MEIAEIKTLIEEEKYQRALDKIKRELESKKLNLNNEEDYNKYKTLLSLRITANAFRGEHDDLVNAAARKERFPYQSKIDFGNGDIVTLWEKDILQIPCDAYINTFHEKEFFNYNAKSFSKVFSQHFEKEDLENQIKKQFGKSKNYYIIEHPNLSAPKSYHIPAIWNINNIDRTVLKIGLKEVFAHITKTRLKSISMVALAASVDIPDPNSIVELIADEINLFFEQKPKDYNPDINIAFVNYKSLRRYEKILQTRTNRGKYILRDLKNLNELEKKIISKANTADYKYAKQLRKLSLHINSEATILLLGETGVGKSYLAKYIIHLLSNKPVKSFIQINCAAFPENLMHSKIFGHTKDAFTGAIRETKSIFEIAEGGTVFLDEIGYASTETQLALLTVLSEKEYQKVGGEKTLRVKCRVVLGTENHLEELLNEGKFHRPLYERISNEIKIIIPSLRERVNDIDIIINDELEKLNKKNKLEIEIDEETRDLLRSYPWPGNYRQLHLNINRWYREAQSQGRAQLTKQQIKDDPPRTTFFNNGRLSKLENLLEEYLREWDYNKDGKFLEEFIKPIFSKVYLENLKDVYNKSESNKVLGIDGDRANSKIEQYLIKYYENNIDKIK